MSAYSQVESQARALTAQERAKLAEILLMSLREATRPEIAAAWDREVERRVADYRSGSAELFDAEDVFAEARALAR